MNPADVDRFRQELLRLRAELEELCASSRDASATVELDQTRQGRLSRMDAMQSQQIALEAARRREHQLAMIDGALRRIDSGDFGYCYKCGEEIDLRRLSGDPTITRCVACADR